jgi:hypothetical protein
MCESPVDVIIGIRKDLEEFRRTSSKEALRAAYREALWRGFAESVSAPGFDIRQTVEYLEDRGVIRSKPSRARRRHQLKRLGLLASANQGARDEHGH